MRMPLLKAFMGDTTIVAPTEDHVRGWLKRLDKKIRWCRLSFRPNKSRSLSFVNVGQQEIPTAIKVSAEYTTLRWLRKPQIS